MGTVGSTSRKIGDSGEHDDHHLTAIFAGAQSYPLSSPFWHNFLLSPRFHLLPSDRLSLALLSFARNNCHTRHLAKLLIHLANCLHDYTAGASSVAFTKALNATYLSSLFLKHTIENTSIEDIGDLYLSLDENEDTPDGFPKGQTLENVVLQSVLSFISRVEISPHTYLLHCELLKFMMVAMSTQLLSQPSPDPKDTHPFLIAAMNQEAPLVASVVQRLLLNYISPSWNSLNDESYLTYSEGSQSGVLQKVGSAAANFVLLPLNLFTSPNNDGSRSLLAQTSLHVLLILVHFHNSLGSDEPISNGRHVSDEANPLPKEKWCYSENPYRKALENVRDVEFDRVDVEGNAHSGPLARVPFASLFDTLGMSLGDESASLLLYSLVHGNADFLEYVLVRTDLDTLLMPILETLYNASNRTSNQIYMLLIILLILSQDPTFNASIHKLVVQNVPWYQERRLHHTTLGSLMVIILIRTVRYNLSRLQDIYLHTNCLAILANMAPHVHRLDGYASQSLVMLCHMLLRKYTKIGKLQNDKTQISKVGHIEGDGFAEDVLMELHVYTDFLRIVLEIINSILTYALPRNPEFVYAIMHRQEVFESFRNQPRFSELLENIFTVLDFFNSRMDAKKVDGEFTVAKVFEVITNNCKYWRGEGMKMFTQLRFTYEQESHPEEFFIPYVWQLAISNCGLLFNSSKINLFSVTIPKESQYDESSNQHQNEELGDRYVDLDP